MDRPKKQKTYQGGANAVRDSVVAKFEDDLERIHSQIVKKYIRSRIVWVRGHNERTDSRPGGLGRK